MTPTPAPLPREEIERIDRLHEAATPGPWRYDRTTISAYVWPEKGPWICNLVIPADCWGSETIENNPGSHDARLIVALRNAWPSIKAEIEAGRAGAERVDVLEHELRRGLFERGYSDRKADAVSRDVFQIMAQIRERKAALCQAAQPADGAQDLEATVKRLRGTLRYIAAQAKAGYPTVLSVILANAEAALDDDWQATYRAAEDEIRRQSTTHAVPAQIGAQPAGRVEAMVRRRFVIVNEPGQTPDKKGPFATGDHLINFLREGLPIWPTGSRITVVRIVDGDDIWLDDGREYLTIHDALADATPPTAGAGDDQENGNG